MYEIIGPNYRLSGLSNCRCNSRNTLGTQDPEQVAQAKRFPWFGFSVFMAVAGIIALMIGYKVDPTPVFEVVSKIQPNRSRYRR